MASNQVVYDTYYSMYMLQNVNLYLSWSNVVQTWGYLNDPPKALWFDKVNGTNSGPILTGDLLQLALHIGLGTNYLRARGTTDWTAQWSSPPDTSSYNWYIWTDTAHTPGLPITLGQTVWFTNQNYAGSYLIQYLPNYPDYLTAGPATVPCQFQIRTENGALTYDEQDLRQSPPPPDTKRDL